MDLWLVVPVLNFVNNNNTASAQVCVIYVFKAPLCHFSNIK